MLNLMADIKGAGAFVIVVILALASLALIIYLIWRIRKEKLRFNETPIEHGILTMDALQKYVDGVITSGKKKIELYLYQIDIRDFYQLYKTIGDVQYENMIKEISEILTRLLPWGIKIAKKQDRSMVMCCRNMGTTDIEKFSELIIKNLNKTMVLSGDMKIDLEVNISVSYYPDAGDTFEALNKKLDICMVVSKRKGKNNYVIYTSKIGNSETEEYRYYEEIRDAIKSKDFMLYYQPIVDGNSLEISSAESLIRWKHKTKGVLAPNSFLHIMEKTGDIYWVGMWCFEEIIKQLVSWQSNFEQRFTLNLNISERQLLTPSLADDMKKMVRQYKINPSNFVMEIEDLSLYTSSAVAKSNLDDLMQFGFPISVDFGSHFNDLSLLENLKLAYIKIDAKYWKKTVDSNISANIVQMLVRYSQEKRIFIVAMGVETADDLIYLRSIGINHMQGYLFSAPKSPKDFIGDVLLTPWIAELSPENIERSKQMQIIMKEQEIEDKKREQEALEKAKKSQDNYNLKNNKLFEDKDVKETKSTAKDKKEDIKKTDKAKTEPEVVATTVNEIATKEKEVAATTDKTAEKIKEEKQIETSTKEEVKVDEKKEEIKEDIKPEAKPEIKEAKADVIPEVIEEKKKAEKVEDQKKQPIPVKAPPPPPPKPPQKSGAVPPPPPPPKPTTGKPLPPPPPPKPATSKTMAVGKTPPPITRTKK